MPIVPIVPKLPRPPYLSMLSISNRTAALFDDLDPPLFATATVSRDDADATRRYVATGEELRRWIRACRQRRRLHGRPVDDSP